LLSQKKIYKIGEEELKRGIENNRELLKAIVKHVSHL
jgi:hypothetical protein